MVSGGRPTQALSLLIKFILYSSYIMVRHCNIAQNTLRRQGAHTSEEQLHQLVLVDAREERVHALSAAQPTCQGAREHTRWRLRLVTLAKAKRRAGCVHYKHVWIHERCAQIECGPGAHSDISLRTSEACEGCRETAMSSAVSTSSTTNAIGIHQDLV